MNKEVPMGYKQITGWGRGQGLEKCKGNQTGGELKLFGAE